MTVQGRLHSLENVPEVDRGMVDHYVGAEPGHGSVALPALAAEGLPHPTV